MPHHIKFIYIMMLKHNRTARSLLKRNWLSWMVSSGIPGSFDVGMDAVVIEEKARKLIKEYMVLQ